MHPGRHLAGTGRTHRPGRVNISPQLLLDSTLVDTVTAALHAHNLPAAQLVLEVTESGPITDIRTAAATCRRLRQLRSHHRPPRATPQLDRGPASSPSAARPAARAATPLFVPARPRPALAKDISSARPRSHCRAGGR